MHNQFRFISPAMDITTITYSTLLYIHAHINFTFKSIEAHMR